MISINASEAQSRLYDLIEEASLSHKPLIIAGNKSNAAGSNGFCGHRRQPPKPRPLFSSLKMISTDHLL